jgi:hypothetical protein
MKNSIKCNSKSRTNNVPLDPRNDVPLDLVVQKHYTGAKPKRRHSKYLAIQALAEQVFRKTGRSITYNHLLYSRFARSKPEAQLLLKRSRMGGFLFTFKNRRPQQYYPSNRKSEVMKYLLSENAPIDPTGVDLKLEGLRQEVRFQTLIEYVLPMLPEAPLGVHNLHLYFSTKPNLYGEVSLAPSLRNRGKRSQQRIGHTMVTCIFYPNGTVDVQIACSNKPFRFESSIDVSHLVAFLGEVRAFVCTVLSDSHGRTIPVVLDWMLAECDINKDIAVSEAFQVASLKVQEKIRVRDFECMLRIYFKSIGPNTVVARQVV